jgi:hypothetical protein
MGILAPAELIDQSGGVSVQPFCYQQPPLASNVSISNRSPVFVLSGLYCIQT